MATDKLRQAADEVACFDHLKKIVGKLPFPKTPDYESEAQKCMEELLKMEKEMKVMDKLDELKHIRRELHVISEVVEQQENVICQMFDNLKHGEFEMFQIRHEPHRMRLEKMERRKKRIDKLDQKAASIFKDVSMPNSDEMALVLFLTDSTA